LTPTCRNYEKMANGIERHVRSQCTLYLCLFA